MAHEDLAYYRSRAAAEAELARHATHPNAAAAHRALASEYLKRAGMRRGEGGPE